MNSASPSAPPPASDDARTAPAMTVKRAFLRRQAAALSPVERLRRQHLLQAEAWRLLQASPAGHEAFLRRNLRRRRRLAPPTTEERNHA